MVHVAIHGHRACDLFITLHAANGDGHIVNHAEAFAVVREGMMKSAADIKCHPILQSIISREN